jgi:hypothetical protein
MNVLGHVFIEQGFIEVEVEVNLRPTAGLGVRHPFGTRDHFVFLFEIFFRQLRVC